jgi:CRP-like cAMP-binding protein
VKKNISIDQVVALLSKTALFADFTPETLRVVAGFCEANDFSVGDVVCDSSEGTESIPLIVITKGCVGVLGSLTGVGDRDHINAVIAPFQLLCEFQFLGDGWPEEIELISFAETEALKINIGFVSRLDKDHEIKLYRNLGVTLVEKLNAVNRYLYLRGIHNVDVKLAHYLTELRKYSLWQRFLVKKDDDRVDINIIWTVHYLAEYLSCSERSILNQLAQMVEAKAIRLKWFDRNGAEIAVNDIELIKTLNQRDNVLKFDTRFQIIEIDRDNIREFFEPQKVRNRMKRGPKS